MSADGRKFIKVNFETRFHLFIGKKKSGPKGR